MNERICGIDEAGRGALAGPLVAAGVVLPCSIHTLRRVAKAPIRDGKTLTKPQRERVYRALTKLGAEIHSEIVSARRINNRGIQRANREAIRTLVKRIDADRYIIDGKIRLGRIKGKTAKVQTVVDADATIPEVILAGIVAKVERDKIMQRLDRLYPHYRWRRNAGYATRLHREMILQHGTVRFHRSVFVTTALRSLVPKRFDGVEAAGTDGRRDPKDDADQRGKSKRERH